MFEWYTGYVPPKYPRDDAWRTPQPLPAYTTPPVPNIRFIFPTEIQAERATAAAKRNQQRPGYKGRVW